MNRNFSERRCRLWSALGVGLAIPVGLALAAPLEPPAVRRSEAEVFRAPVAVERRSGTPEQSAIRPEIPVTRRWVLPALPADESRPGPGASRGEEAGRALQVGVTRPLDRDRGADAGGGTWRWTTTAEGHRRTRFQVTSTGAQALRVAFSGMRIPAGARFWFSGPDAGVTAGGARRFGPVAAGTLLDGPIYWSPVVPGETVDVEIELPAGVPAESLRLDVARVSHLWVDPAWPAAKWTGIGSAAGCAPDVVCTQPTPALSAVSSGVARMLFTRPEGTYLCTGTLVADQDPASQIPWFLTANHCISDEDTARTLQTYWFFEATVCGMEAAPAQQIRTGGAALMVTDEALDNTLLRLKDDPPAGTTLAGFDANPMGDPVAAIGLHHPRGDLKKRSDGAIVGYGDFNGQGSFVQVQWDRGVTEGGSSGSGLFTYANGAYYLRGALKGGSSYCEAPTGNDLYSRLDLAWAGLGPYLGTGRSGTTIVEYHAGGDRYFLTGLAEEIAALDAGTIPGWTRSGQTFLADAQGGAGLAGMCRFYGQGATGSAPHFYTAYADECQALKTSTYWRDEGLSFYVALPTVTGACMDGGQPLFRLYNQARGGAPRHRYTVSRSVRAQMLADGWLAEGSGSEGVVACVR